VTVYKGNTAVGKAESHVTDADVVPVTPQGEDGGFSETGGVGGPPEESPEGPAVDEETKRKMWMDFDVFCKCFK